MRMRHVLAVAIAVGAVMVMNPVAARAERRGVHEFDRTHYLPGDVATAGAVRLSLAAASRDASTAGRSTHTS